MKTIEEMTLEELYAEKKRLIEKYKMILGMGYAMERIILINRRIMEIEYGKGRQRSKIRKN